MPEQETIARIKSLLKIHPKGLTITEISSHLKMNRNSVAKYLEVLLVSGHVEAQVYGNTRVFFSTHRIPVSAMVGMSSDLVLILNEHHEVLFTNESFNRFFSVTKQDVAGCHLVNLPLGGYAGLMTTLSDIIARQETMQEARIPKDSTEFYFRIKGMPVVFDDGGRGTAITMEDVTTEKEDQIRLAASEARYRAVVDAQTDLICRRKPDGSITFANKEFLRFFHKTAAEVEGCLFFPPDLELSAGQDHGDPKSGIQPFYQDTYEQCVLLDQGGIRWLQWKNTLLYGPEETVAEIQSAGRDITLQRLREREIILKQCSIESCGHAMILFDVIGRIVYANRSFLDLFGYPDERGIIGMPFEQVISQSGPASNINQLIGGVMESGTLDCFCMGIRADGTEIDLELHGTLIKNDLNFPLHTLVLLTGRSGNGPSINRPSAGPACTSPEPSAPEFPVNIDQLSELLQMPLFITDSQRRVIFWSRAMEAFTGVKASDILGKTTYQEVLSRCYGHEPLLIDMVSEPLEKIRQVFPDVRMYGDTIILERYLPASRAWDRAWLYEKASVLFDPAGMTVGYMEGFLNITTWKRSQEMMNRMKDEIEKSLHPYVQYLEEKIDQVPETSAI